MKEKILRRVLVILVIASLTINNFLLIGLNIVEAVNENLENQTVAVNNYVDYDVYFKEGDKKVHSIESSIKGGTSLYINVNVKDTGVALDAGKISFENSNFKLGKVKNTAVKSVNYETKEIELNEIIYGNNIEIELPITFEKNENIDVAYFDAINSVKLEGTYRKGTTDKKVSAERKIELKWTEKADIEVEENIEKYFEVAQGIVLQDSIKVSVIENVLPKQSEKIEIKVPEVEGEKPSKVTVIKNGKVITGAEINEEGKLNIETENKTWANGKDEYKIIYVYIGALEASEREIGLDTKVETKLYSKEEKIQKTNEEVEVINKKGNIASVDSKITEEQYKGYIYANAKEETEYEEVTTIEVANKSEQQIKIELNEDEFVDVKGNRYSTQGATYYKEIKINKDDVLKLFGENAYIAIEKENGELIRYIDKDVQADRNGNIVLNSEENTIIIRTNEPEKAGSLKIYSKKAIKGNAGYTKGQLKQVTGLVSNVNLKTDEYTEEAKAEMKLKETETDAEIILSQIGLSTLKDNNVKIDVNLKTDDNKYDLYKNPTIEIKLPEEVTGVEINSVNQLYKKQLSLKDYKYNEETKTIRIEYEGEQTEFGNASNEGMFIEIDATIKLNKLATTKSSEIVMTYTNENGEEATYEKKVDININSKTGILTYTSVSGYNEEGAYVESVGSDIAEGKLEEQSNAKVAKAKVAVINNYNEEIKNVEVIGEIPAENESELKSTFVTTLAEGIKTIGDAKVYYSEDGQNWKEEIEDLAKIRKYKVVPNSNEIKAKGALAFVYEFNIPANLGKGESTYTNYEVKYNYAGQEVKTSSTVILSTDVKEKAKLQEEIKNVSENNEEIEGTNKVIEGIELNYKAISNGKELKDGETVKEGQSIKYVVKAKNVSGKDINNFKAIAEQTNATFYGEEIVEAISVTPEAAYNRYIEEDENLKNKEFTKEVLKNGEEYEFSYEFTVKNVEEGQTTEGKLTVLSENTKQPEVKLNTNVIEQGKLKIVLKSEMTEDWEFTSRECSWPMDSKVTNISNETLRNVIVEIPLQDWVKTSKQEINEVIDENSNYTLISYENNVIKFNIKEIRPNEQIRIFYPIVLVGMDSEKTVDLFRLNYIAYVQGEEDVIYTSNEIQKEVKQANRNTITIEQTSDKNENETIKEDEEVTFNAVIRNEGVAEKEIRIADNISEELTIVDAYYEFNGQTIILDLEKDTKETIRPNDEIKITVKAKAKNIEDATRALSNEFEIETDDMASTSNSIKYRVASAVNNREENNETETNIESYYDIEGTAWEDKDKNGIKDDQNSNMSDIKVYLINSVTGELVKDTNIENGNYSFGNLEKGKYIVAFDYNTTKYRVTTYKKAGVIEENNSNVISKEININGEIKKMAVTDIIEVTNESVANINAGFVEKEIVDFKLDKYVTKVTLQNNKGTTVKEYKNTKLAKLEINPKEVDKSLVLIEYAIDVTNEGELEGYIGEILDYIPNDLKFSSEINKDWYISSDGTLHNITLANDKLEAGETKQVKLILTKTMTKENMGLIINSAEIGKLTNEFEIEDIDSTPSNKIDGEDDLSKAEVIISLTTGKEMIMIITISLIAIIITGIVIKIVISKEGKNE